MKPVHMIVIALVIVAVVCTMTAGCGKKAEAQQYTCPMHPEVVQDKPGKCPKCGMDLVPKTDAAKPADSGK